MFTKYEMQFSIGIWNLRFGIWDFDKLTLTVDIFVFCYL